MNFNKTFYSFMVIVFIVSSSFLGSYTPNFETGVPKNFFIPGFLAGSAFFLYSSLLMLVSLVGFIDFINGKKNIAKSHLFLSLAFSLLFIWSVVTSAEILRYGLLFFSVVFFPFGFKVFLSHIPRVNLNRIIVSSFLLCLLVSSVFSILNFPTHVRISGFHSNPNLMGMWVVSFLAMVLMCERLLSKNVVSFCIAFAGINVLMTGSRLATVVFIVLLLPFLLNRRYLTVILIATGLALLYLTISETEMNLRGLDVGNAVSDSGRIVYWRKAVECIIISPLTGYGMNGAITCVGVGNVHNAYLRTFVMLGVPLGLIFFTFYFSFIYKVLTGNGDKFTKLYFIGVPMAFFAEDYVTGFGSPFFPFFLMMFTFAAYYNSSFPRRN